MNTTAPGKQMLMVVGIIGVIFSSLGLVGGLVGLAFFPMLGALGFTSEIPGWSMVIISTVIALLFTVFFLYAYIMAIANAAKLEKAIFLKKLGIISVVVVVISTIIDFIVTLVTTPAIMEYSMNMVERELATAGLTAYEMAFFTQSMEMVNSFASAGVTVGFIFGLLVGLVLPVLYIVGASKNVKAFEESKYS